MKKKLLALLLAALMLIPMLAACDNKTNDSSTTTEGTESSEDTGSTEPGSTDEPIDPPDYTVDPNASVYSGTPDTSWYTGDKTEYTLTSADQFVGFHALRSETLNYEGITIKLDCDVILNPGTAEEIKAKGSGNHSWRQLNSAYLFKGTFDGQGHVISGLYMQLTTSAVRGMFGGVGGNAVIKNFTLTESYFGGPSGVNKHSLGAIAAKIAGENANVTISNVNVKAILEEGSATFTRVGGFVGSVTEAVNLTMENCQFEGSISITGDYAGGMIGYVSVDGGSITMTNCANRGSITSTNYAGGMTGILVVDAVTQTNCQNLGTVTAVHDANDLNGRICLMNDPTNGARPTEIPEGTTALRVMSFNVQGSLTLSGGVASQASQNRIDAVRTEILYYSPDLLGLQEDKTTWTAYLKLDDYNVIQDSSSGADVERCAIYYKKGLKLLTGGTVWLTATRTSEGAGLTYEDLTTPGSKYYMTPAELEKIDVHSTADLKRVQSTYVNEAGQRVDSTEGNYVLLDTRKMTYGVFDINGQIVIYVNTHLQHRKQNAVYSNDAFQKIRSMERLKEFDLLQETLAELKKQYPDAVEFFTGDWNDQPYSAIYESIVTDYGYTCANFATNNKYGVNGSWNNAFDLSVQGDSYPSSKDGTTSGYLDYCFLGEGVDVLKFRVGEGKATINQKDGTTKTIYTSDHLPIITDLCFKTPKTGSPIDPDYQDPNVKDPTLYSGILDTSWYTGDKTEYTLTSADQLMGFQNLRAQKVTFEGVTIKLGCDMIINQGTLEEIIARGADNYAWKQLNSSYLFLGTFDGQGYTISGVYMQLTTSAVRGMFGGVSGNAVIKNFTLENYYIGGPSADKQTLGGLIARITGDANVTISNVNIRNTTMTEGTGALSRIGGFVGYVEGGSTLTMENCSFQGSLKFGTKGSQIGGFVGAALSGATVVLNNCNSQAAIEALSASGDFVGYEETGSTVTKTDCTTK